MTDDNVTAEPTPKSALTRPERRSLAQMKASFLRTIAEHEFTVNDLLEIFGMAFRAKLYEPATRHQQAGKHHSFRRGHSNHPAGTKLVRSFLRGNGDSVHYNAVYKLLTGHAYRNHEST